MRAAASPLALLGGTIVLLIVLVGVLAPILSPYDPRALAGDSLLPPSIHHLLGTNDVGQDIFSEVVWGARISISVAVGGAGLAIFLGVLIGAGAGLLGGMLDVVAMRVVDVFLALPVLPLLILLAVLIGPSLASLILVIGLLAWPHVARVLRSQTLSLRQRGFVRASHGFGGGPLYVLRRHLVPALGPIIVVSFVNVAAAAVLLESGLAFLGLADPTSVSWGLMLNRAFNHEGLYFTSLWVWWVLPPGFAITLTVLGFTFLGVGLEPHFNPRWTRGR